MNMMDNTLVMAAAKTKALSVESQLSWWNLKQFMILKMLQLSHVCVRYNHAIVFIEPVELKNYGQYKCHEKKTLFVTKLYRYG